jgi:hypothetical protein
MMPDEFADSLARLAPSRSRLQEAGFSNAFIERLLARQARRRRCAAPMPEGAPLDALLILLVERDVSSVVVGQVEFLADPESHAEGWQVGNVEADLLVVRRDREVAVYEHGTERHLLWRAAEDGNRFLDALVAAAEYLVKRLLGDVAYEDLGQARAVAQECAARAGGPAYLNFYLMLLG